MMKLSKFVFAALLAIGAAPIAQATTISTATGASTIDPNTNVATSSFTVSTTDLIEAGAPSLLSLTALTGGANFGSQLAALNDGTVYSGPTPGNANAAYNSTVNSFAPFSGTDNTSTPNNGTTVEADLNGAFNIASVVSLTGYNDSRTGQSYTLSVEYAAAPGVFVPVAVVNYPGTSSPNANGERQVTITPTANELNGVDKLQFAFLNAQSAPLSTTFLDSVYREIDVNAVAAVPEPASFVLFGLGAVGLFFATRRRRQA